MSPTASIPEALKAWYEAQRRALPWRDAPTPWRVWISEIMLQQTRVSSVIPYFERFIARFPDPASLAAAPLDDVLSLWAGLGYYARARNLHAAAGQIVARHGGVIPDDPAAFAALKGVGRYTLGAVMSIAFGRRLPALDGNLTRVICRLDLIEEDPRAKATQDRLWRRAAALVDDPQPGEINQALMELGATVCTPKSPACLLCPLAAHCRARAEGAAARLPKKTPKAARPTQRWRAALLRDEGGVLLGQRPTEGLLGGLWEPPQAPDEAGLAAMGIKTDGEARVITHAFTHLIWEVEALEGRAVEGGVEGGGYTAFKRVAEADLGGVALTGPALKALRAWGVAAPKRR
ncbi:A/G-specific adenine glycosylase, partial [Myxococcota bacterium]|nr:A/G-specific adenine glycosylase [Myxococcota bacterium]